jgi:SAM-dependent methyltransferase
MENDYRDEPPEVFQRIEAIDYARFYALEMADYAEDVPFYRHFLGQRGTILEVGCGDGRLGRRLAAFGYKVLGIDNSLAMLRLAVRRLPPGFAVAAMDMRRLAFARPFSAAIAAHNTLNLLAGEEEVRQTLAACHAALREDGRLLLHLFLPEQPAPSERHMQFKIMPLPGGGQLIKEIIRHYPPGGETVALTERYKYRPKGGMSRQNYRREMTLSAWPSERWRHLFTETGWRIRFFSADAPQYFPFAAGRGLLAVLDKNHDSST